MPGYVFICYARDDQEFVLKLATNLKERGVPIWLDQWHIPPGADWDQSIDDALYDCAQFLIVLSPTAVDSREVRGELRTALEESKPILPVLYRTCRIPRQLRLFQHLDFTSFPPDDSTALTQVLRALNLPEAPASEPPETEPETVIEPRVEPATLEPSPPEPAKPEPRPDEPQVPESRKMSRTLKFGALAGVAVLLLIAGWWYVFELVKTEAPPEKEDTNSIGMKFVYIPSGTFMMGNSLSPKEIAREYGAGEGTAEWFENEYPQHRVTISRPFYLQSTEVTQGQWKKVMGNNPSHFEDCGEDCPVEQVSWNDAQDFIKKLNEMENTGKYRLPTEAEWEYACRAGSTTAFSFGDEMNWLGEYAWYWNNSEGRTHPVGQKKPNGWGLYDMHGNVWEWCQDWYGDYPSGEVSDPGGPSTGDGRVLRGGAWSLDDPGDARSADRNRIGPDYRDDSIGFRIVRDF